MESYKILAAWGRGVRIEEEWSSKQGLEEEKGEEQEVVDMIESQNASAMDESQNKKRKQFSVYLEEGLEQPSL